MTDYIMADIKRILHKNSFLTCVAVFFIIYAGLFFIYFNPTFTPDMYVTKTTSYLSYFPLIVGLFVFMSVYADDFKCKSMQMAIGYGFSRKKIIASKLLESLIILFGVSVIAGVVITIVPSVLGLSFTSQLRLSLVLTMLSEMLRAFGYITISAIAVFLTQNAVNGIIVYVLLATKSVYIILSMILGQDIVARTLGDLSKYLYTNQLYMAKATLLQNGRLEIGIVIAVALAKLYNVSAEDLIKSIKKPSDV